MALFWHWCVRAPFALAGIAGIAAAAAGIVDWPLGLASLTVGAFVADIAHHLGSRARARRRATTTGAPQRTMATELGRARAYGRVDLDDSAGERAA